jgi:predicted DNA-binding WGR domain protein
MDKFYIMQLIVHEDIGCKNEYYVFTKWGKTGSSGQTQLTACSSFNDAKKLFEEKFYEKTHNAWDNRDNFVKYNGYYNMIKINHASKSAMTTSSGASLPISGASSSSLPVWEYYVDDNVDGKINGILIYIYYIISVPLLIVSIYYIYVCE